VRLGGNADSKGDYFLNPDRHERSEPDPHEFANATSNPTAQPTAHSEGDSQANR